VCEGSQVGASITNLFSGPGTVVMHVCLSVWMMTPEQNDDLYVWQGDLA